MVDAVAEIDLPVEAPPEPAAVPLERAQAVDCGGVRIAVPFSWARNIVETFVLSAAPMAPPWLAGATNIDGKIVPVIDLAAWLDAARVQPIDRHSRLLLGGSGDDAFALLFSGLPALVRWQADADGGVTPHPMLQPHVIGAAAVAVDEAALPVVDMAGLCDTWVSELSV